jgi:hypothetical protein
MIIEHRPCPRCQVPNTARIADGIAVCFNCRASWRPDDPEGTVSTPSVQRQEPPPYRFTAGELARLPAYRAAVWAGYYNEGLAAEAGGDAGRRAT